ncbi:MAG TPA: pitrilysin family protein [Candidatus Methylomirabilis sp.]|nr:pitrilysin family protein [Candidatus Methylomirabilis sp.]
MQTVRLDDAAWRSDAPNGLVILTERMPWLRSAAAGFWVKTASAHEPREKMGVSHLLEHMVFKGTPTRSTQDIAVALESRGGGLDAYTGRDHTTYQARMLDADLPLAVDLLTDIVRRPLLRDADLALERKVVLEEIATVDDTPDDLVFDLHAAALWRSHAYGYRILGTRETVAGITAADLQALHRRTYLPRHLVFAAAGNLEHEQVLGLLQGAGWLDLEPGPETAPVPPPEAASRLEQRVARDGAQVHLVFGTETFRYGDPRRHALVLVSTIFGSGMSSRLFQRVREELGLAYTVYAFHSFFQASGAAGVYVGTQPPTAERAAETIREELARLAKDSLTAEELASAKQQVKGQLVLMLESPVPRMYRLAGSALYREAYKTIDAVLAEVDAVTADQVAAVASEFYAPDRQVVVWLGPS